MSSSRKGYKVLVKGEMKESQPWQDRNGNWRASLEMRASNVRFLTTRMEAEQMNGAGPAGHNANPSGGAPAAEAEEDIPSNQAPRPKRGFLCVQRNSES